PHRAYIVVQAPRALAAVAPHDVAEPGLTLALRPRVHAVAECARTTAGARDGPDLVLRCLQHPGAHLEAGTAEMLGDFLHQDRVAQVRLVGTVFAHGIGVSDERE